jgi:hypothetical protein
MAPSPPVFLKEGLGYIFCDISHKEEDAECALDVEAGMDKPS